VVIDPVVEVLARWRVTPNMLTVAGCVAHVPAAWLIAAGSLRLGAIALVLAAAVDGLDGSLARKTGTASRQGAFLDSTFDRISEVIVFFGILLYAESAGLESAERLALLGLAGSLMVSYTRARSEGVGCPTKAGVLGRLERMLVLGVGLFLGLVTPTLAVLAVGAWITAGQRIYDVWQRYRSGDCAG
jgi:CDP-diacylglycerol--glycerol-3-phosphate 3-phosphatidyltransferase